MVERQQSGEGGRVNNVVLLKKPDSIPNDAMIVQLRVSELRELITDAVREAVNKNATAPTELLKLEQAARRLNQSKDWLYRHWKEVGGKKLGPKSIRFAVSDIEKFIAKRGA